MWKLRSMGAEFWDSFRMIDFRELYLKWSQEGSGEIANRIERMSLKCLGAMSRLPEEDWAQMKEVVFSALRLPLEEFRELIEERFLHSGEAKNMPVVLFEDIASTLKNSSDHRDDQCLQGEMLALLLHDMKKLHNLGINVGPIVAYESS